MIRRVRIGVSVIVGVLIVVVFLQYREARYYAVHSYVLSVCSAVEKFHEEHGEYPPSLDQIDKSMLDYDLGIPLQDLDYEVSESSYQLSYRVRDGREISCP
jgi:hypothetical protein